MRGITATLDANETIGAVTVTSTGYASLKTLSDVDATNLDDGYMLVYNAVTDTFITRPDLYKTVIDCGTF